MENKVGTDRKCLSCWLDFTVPQGVLEAAGGTGRGPQDLMALWTQKYNEEFSGLNDTQSEID